MIMVNKYWIKFMGHVLIALETGMRGGKDL
jgi:hypothetical protein